MSVLCGGLKLIFGAAKRLDKIRDGICEALEDIPTLITRTDTTLNIFDNVELRACSRKLMGSTLDTLRQIVLELRASAASKANMLDSHKKLG